VEAVASSATATLLARFVLEANSPKLHPSAHLFFEMLGVFVQVFF
jgi:hypothetical protein